MWLCVDRIEAATVILLDDSAHCYTLSTAAYEALVGRAPAESDMLRATLTEGVVTAATYDEAETAARQAEAQALLDRLRRRGPASHS